MKSMNTEQNEITKIQIRIVSDFRSQQQTDLRFDDFTKGRKHFLKSFVVGGPGKSTNKASVFNFRHENRERKLTIDEE